MSVVSSSARRQALEVRDQAIEAAYCPPNRLSMDACAKMHNITRQRVQQILKKRGIARERSEWVETPLWEWRKEARKSSEARLKVVSRISRKFAVPPSVAEAFLELQT